MKRPAWVLAIVALAAILSACAGNSTSGVHVVGHNTARLPVGETMVLYKGGKSARTWDITYDGRSTVHFHCEELFCSDMDITVDDIGVEIKADGGLFQQDMYVTKRSENAVDVRWDWGLDFQAPKN